MSIVFLPIMALLSKIKDLLTLGSANLISSAIIGLFMLFLASFLAKESYGELGFFLSLANIGSVIAIMGVGATVVVYEAKNQNIFPASFVLVLISSAILSAVFFVLTQNAIASILLIGMTIFFIILQGLNGKKRYQAYSLNLVLRAVVFVPLSFALFQFFGINGILLGFFIASLLILKELKSLLKNKKIDFSILRSKFKFTSYNFGNRLSYVLLWYGDKLLIASMFDFSFLGSYYFATQFLMLLDTIPRALAQYLVPQESQGQKNKNLKIFSIVFASIVCVISILVAPIGITALLPQYQEIIVPIQVLSLAIIPLSISMIQQSEIFGRENSKFILIGSAFQTGLYLSLAVVLGLSYGLLGIAVGFLISAILRTIFNLFERKKITT